MTDITVESHFDVEVRNAEGDTLEHSSAEQYDETIVIHLEPPSGLTAQNIDGNVFIQDQDGNNLPFEYTWDDDLVFRVKVPQQIETDYCSEHYIARKEIDERWVYANETVNGYTPNPQRAKIFNFSDHERDPRLEGFELIGLWELIEGFNKYEKVRKYIDEIKEVTGND